ncbi:MAG: hypothetical protein R2722_05470 [Tessaracoccus sp.]
MAVPADRDRGLALRLRLALRGTEVVIEVNRLVRADRLDPDDAPWFIDAILLPAFTNATQPGRAQ